jgi:hypothetical protein
VRVAGGRCPGCGAKAQPTPNPNGTTRYRFVHKVNKVTSRTSRCVLFAMYAVQVRDEARARRLEEFKKEQACNACDVPFDANVNDNPTGNCPSCAAETVATKGGAR